MKNKIIPLILLMIPLFIGATPQEWALADLAYQVKNNGYQEALEEFLKGDLSPYEEGFALYTLGLGHFFRGKEEEAEALFRQVEGMTPLENSYKGRGLLLLARTRVLFFGGVPALMKEGAKLDEDYQAYLAENPRDPLARFMVAQGLMNKPRLFGGNPKEAVEMIQDVVSENSESPSWQFEAALALSKGYAKTRRKAESRQWFQRAKDIYPQHPALLAWEEDLP